MTTPADVGRHQHHVDPSELVALGAYRREVLERIEPLEPLALGVLEAHGCVLAEDVVAPAAVPGFDNSAMDGYAVRATDAPVDAELEVVGELAAGAGAGHEVGPGQAVRIMTGAPLPVGADAVVPVEVADEHEGRVRLRRAAAAGDNVRPAGEDVAAGDMVLRAGRRLGAADVGMLAAVGQAGVRVHPSPRVVVMSTGDELADPTAPLAAGQIRDSNSFTLAAQAREAGAVAYRQARVADDAQALRRAVEGALAHADLLVTTGGVSAGRYDLVKEVLAAMGDVRARKVGMQPGMPQAFGFVGPMPCFGLPGNPVSAFVSFEVLVRPAIRRLQARADLNRPRVEAVLDDAVASPPHKVSFLRVRLHRRDDGWHARPTGPQGSGILRSVVDAHGLAEVPTDRQRVQPGEALTVHLLGDGV
ncbi:MAG: molybdopterin molybdotransferase MoeA [Actinobacteria bacterium]|nr:molybdopterin molybdotransferase MoeA [Actinomycetota bacterium]